MGKVTLSEDELCPYCHENFQEDFEAISAHSYFYNIDVYLHKDCWEKFLTNGGNAKLDFVEAANKLPI